MPDHLYLKFVTRWRFRLFILLLQIPVVTLCAADKRLVTGPLPAAVAQGNFTSLGRLPSTNQMRLTLDLPLRNAGGLAHLLAAIYNPASPQYHHYLKPGEFTARFGPTPEDYAAVIRFANTNGLTVSGTHSNRLFVEVTGRVAEVERALHIKFNSYRQPGKARSFFAPDTAPTVDARVPLFHVSGLDNFFEPHANFILRRGPSPSPSANDGTGPSGSFMGNDFRQAYVPGTALTGTGQSVALVEFDAFDPSDITNYENTIGLTNNVPQVVVKPVHGGVEYPGGNSVEVCLDIEMVLSMSPGVSNIYVYEAPNPYPYPLPWLCILSRMADDDLTAQISCSWYGGGPDPAAEQVFQQMAAQGQSFYNASGDLGAYNDVVSFPGCSPNITQVGGTYLATDINGNYLGEAAWNREDGYGTGGGECLGVAIPPWQLGLDMTTNGGSTVCRNIPDVALTADNVYIFTGGYGYPTGAGTSCAAPLWAAFTALVNEQAAQLGQPPVGFINPALYALGRGTNYGATFHDIISGSNTNAGSPAEYYAVPGYDLCTGWGTPAGTNLINALTTPDYLGVFPSAISAACDGVGGPFTQTNWTITLTNSGAGCLTWALAGVPAWLAVSADGGMIGPYGSTNLDVQLLNPGALPVGSYGAMLTFTNVALSWDQNVTVQVDVGQSIVQNGGFETGDFTGWTLVGDTVVVHPTYDDYYNIVATDNEIPGVAYSGYFGAFLGENGYAATLSQTLATVPGQYYLFSFWLNNQISAGTQLFSASWDGSNCVNLVNPPMFTWTNFQFMITAACTNTVLQFAAENNANFFALDDVSVTPVLPPLAFGNFTLATNGFQLTWPAQMGRNYCVQYTTNLAPANWICLATNLACTNVLMFTDTNVPDPGGQGYYRLMLMPP
jgi:hypothetical protein